MKTKFRIQFTILVSSLMVLVIACGSIIFYTYMRTTDEYMEQIAEDVEASAKAIFESTNDFLKPAGNTAAFLAWFAHRRSSILDHRDNYITQSMRMLDFFPQINGFYSGDRHGNLLAVTRTKANQVFPHAQNRSLPANALYAVRTIHRSGTSISEFHEFKDKRGRTITVQERPPGAEYYDPRQRPWYKEALAKKGPIWTNPYVFLFSNQIGITAAVPVMDHNDSIAMVISADITLDKISETMKRYKIGRKGITFMLTTEGKMLGYPNMDLVLNKDEDKPARIATYTDTNNPLLIRAFERYKQTGETSFRLSHDGHPHVVVFKPVGDQFHKTWLLGFIINLPELTKESDQMTTLLMIFSFLIVCGAALLIFLISRNIARPIEKVADDLEAIGQFRIDNTTMHDSRFVEIARMNRALESMKRSLKDFARFVPKAVVSKLIESKSGARIGGSKKEITLLFTDIAGFTSLSERMTSEKLIQHLSNYLNEMTLIIQEYHGTIDKYIGDAIMAFWGAPDVDEVHAYHACYAAIQCKKKLDELNQAWELDGKPPLVTRFGLHTGAAIVGNVGSEDRLNYSAFGDSVNLASRLEGINKAYGTSILISHTTYVSVRHKFICRPVDVVTVVGKTEPMKIYELLVPFSDDPKTKFEQEEMTRLSDNTEKAFDHYLHQDWDQAIACYKAVQDLVPEDSVAKLFIQRCQAFKDTSPGEDWDGTYVFTHK